MEEEEVFDLANMNEYDLVSNEDGTVLIQDNCVVIRHKENQGMKLLPLSEEVLQALGLALVIDEDDMKKDGPEDEQSSIAAEVVPKAKGSSSKLQEQDDSDMVEESTISADGEAAEGITIVFTDDEDGEGNVTEQNKERSKHLVWTDDMVKYLLCLYEQHLPLFSRMGRSQRQVWKAILTRMQAKYPHLKRFNEQHLHVKFKGLQRTYKGAMMYWKENLHRTNWVHFEKMHKLMGKQPLLMEAVSPTPVVPEFKSKPDDNINQYFATAQWKPAWLKLTLDVMERQLKRYNQGRNFWKEVHKEVTYTAKDFDVVSPECIEKKMFFLKNMYKELNRAPHQKRRKEFADKYFGQRLIGLFSKLEDSDLEEDDPELCQGPWTASLVSKFLDVCYENQHTIASGSLPSALSKLSAELGVKMSQSELVHMYHSLRNKYNQLTKAPQDARPSYYVKLQRLFQLKDGWDYKSTVMLLDLYSKVRLVLDESGARFWSELAERFNRVSGSKDITPRRCEVKINALLTKYHALTANLDDDSRQWVYFEKMSSIFSSPAKKEWPSNAVNFFLATYQRHLNRFENDDNPEVIWQDIAKAVNSAVKPNFVTAAEAKEKMLEMKDKFGKLMKDPGASQCWPQYKRMAAIFSCHLWSKTNVNILLDAYDENKHRFDSEDAQNVWLDIKNEFNARSNTSAVTETQCKTEMHVLKARYVALKSNVEPSNIFWPFYERMDQVFDKQKQKEREEELAEKRPAMSVRVEVEENDVTMDQESDHYVWTECRITALLDAYERHRELFNTKLRKEVWAIIDKEISESDNDYKQGVRGYGGWLQYMKLMNKYMDIKERRCDHDEWPFYDRMQKMFESRAPGSKGVSTASVASHDSIADKLQELLTESPRKSPDKSPRKSPDKSPRKSPDKSPLKSPDRKRKRDESESEANLSSVFSEDADEQSHSTPLTRCRRSAMAASGPQSWSESETIQLIDACLQNPADSTTDWSEVKRRLTDKIPKFNKSAAQCEEKWSQLKTSFNKNKRFGSKLAMAQRMSHNVFKKMEEYFKAELSDKLKEEPKENGTIKPDPDPDTKLLMNTELQQKLLEQLLIQNEYRRKREEVTKAYQEQALALQREKVEALNRILEAVNKFCLNQEAVKIKKEVQDKLEDKEDTSEEKEDTSEEKEDTLGDKEDTLGDKEDTSEEKEYRLEEGEDKFEDEEDKLEEEQDKLKALVESLQEAIND